MIIIANYDNKNASKRTCSNAEGNDSSTLIPFESDMEQGFTSYPHTSPSSDFTGVIIVHLICHARTLAKNITSTGAPVTLIQGESWSTAARVRAWCVVADVVTGVRVHCTLINVCQRKVVLCTAHRF